MERKLVKQGQNALTATLPASWIKEQGLGAGDVVHIGVDGEQLIVSSKQLAKDEFFSCDVSTYSRSAIFQIILSAYISGYDRIEIMHKDPVTISELSKELVGMVLEEHKPTRSIFSNLIKEPEENLLAIVNRMRFMLQEQAHTLVNLTQDSSLIKKIEQDEKQLDYNILYCMRYINKYERTNYRTFLKCFVYDQIGDMLTELAYHISNDQRLAKNIQNAIMHYTTEQDLSLLNEKLRSFRDSLEKKTFAQGLAYALADLLYNFLGFIHETGGDQHV